MSTSPKHCPHNLLFKCTFLTFWVETFKDLQRKIIVEELKGTPHWHQRNNFYLSIRCHFAIHGNLPKQMLQFSAKLYNSQHGLSWFMQNRKETFQREYGKLFVATSKTLCLWKDLEIFDTKKSGVLFWTGISEALQKSIPHEAVRGNIDTVKYLENKSVVLWEVSSIHQFIFQCQLLYISEIMTLSFIVPLQMIME